MWSKNHRQALQSKHYNIRTWDNERLKKNISLNSKPLTDIIIHVVIASPPWPLCHPLRCILGWLLAGPDSHVLGSQSVLGRSQRWILDLYILGSQSVLVLGRSQGCPRHICSGVTVSPRPLTGMDPCWLRLTPPGVTISPWPLTEVESCWPRLPGVVSSRQLLYNNKRL